jgi:hypothetical protein
MGKREIDNEAAVQRAALLEQLKNEKTGELIDKFISLRDLVDEATNKFKARLKVVTDEMDMIEALLLTRLEESGQESSSSKTGTVFFTTTTRCGVGDWDELLPFIMEGNPQLLNKAVNKTAVKEYMDEHDGELPPGVNWGEERVVQIRKK